MNTVSEAQSALQQVESTVNDLRQEISNMRQRADELREEQSDLNRSTAFQIAQRDTFELVQVHHQKAQKKREERDLRTQAKRKDRRAKTLRSKAKDLQKRINRLQADPENTKHAGSVEAAAKSLLRKTA